MVEFLAALFALVFLVSFFGGIIGLIVPSIFRFGRKERPSRKRIASISLATFVAAFFGFAMTMPEPTPEQKAKAEEAAKARIAEVEKSKAEVEAQAKAKEKAATEEVHKEIVQLWTKITGEGKKCDGSRKKVLQALEQNDRYLAYEIASTASAACRAAHYSVRSLVPPSGLNSEQTDGLRKAIESCAEAYFATKIALDGMLKVIDGDARPSSVTEAKAAAEYSQIATMQCAAKFLSAGHGAGVPLGQIAAGSPRSLED